MNEDPPEVTGITVFGLHRITDDGAGTAAPVLFPADVVDILLITGSWGRGKLHGLRTAPPPERWPERWRVLAEPPDGA